MTWVLYRVRAECDLTGSWGSCIPPINFQPPRVLHIGEEMHCLQSVGRHSRHSAEIVGEEIKSTSSQYLNATLLQNDGRLAYSNIYRALHSIAR